MLFLFIQRTSAYNTLWMRLDKKIITKTINIDRKNPKTVEQLFKRHDKEREKENLGFGWKIWQTGLSGGYISIKATFYYLHDSIMSYTITPQLPDEPELIEKYKKWYCDKFQYSSTCILPFNYNEENILRPLTEYNGKLTVQTAPEKLLKYMSPKSGTMYGYAGGYGGHLLQNRKSFLQIKDSLSIEQVIFLMYSINPASRLTAIEYYFKHKDSFSSLPFLNVWIEKNFTELPTVLTLFGCIGEQQSTRFLVQLYSSQTEQ